MKIFHQDKKRQCSMVAILLMTLLILTACATGAPTQEASDAKELTPCTDPRPQMCTMDYQPVCGQLESGEFKTYSNSCNACSEPTVSGYRKGECE